MGKVLKFKKAKKHVEPFSRVAAIEIDDLEDEVTAILNDFSLTPANRRWILENMLMNIDRQLEAYKKELEKAEQKLETAVKGAEQEIAVAYFRFDSEVRGMEKAVKKLTRTRQLTASQGAAPETPQTDQIK